MKPHGYIYLRKIITLALFVIGVVPLLWRCIPVYFRAMWSRPVILIVLFCLTSGLSSFAQSPSMRCLAVDAAGDVQVTWTPAPDSCGVFYKYYIYFSPSLGGPFGLIDSIPVWATTTYLHTGAGANASSGWYYIEASSGCVNSLSDTLETMFLSVINTPGGTAILQWNAMHAPVVPTSTDMYLIFREDTATGLLQLMDSVSQLPAFVDNFTSCDVTVDYQIGLVDSSGCISYSNIAVLPKDQEKPPNVDIDSVSVDPITGQIIIGWIIAAADVEGYVISLYDPVNAGFFDQDTVYGSNSYLDVGGILNPTDSIFIYAYDSCTNRGPFGAGHSVMKLRNQIDTCRGIATLNWTPYYQWTTGVANYDVYVSQNGGPYINEASVTGTQYEYGPLDRSISYCFYVRAHDTFGTKTSSSNIICTYADTISETPEPFILTVDPRDSLKNNLQWNEDPLWSSALISQYNIYRNFDGGSYSLIGSVPFGTTTVEDILDPITDFITGEGDFCYYVVPIKVSSNLYGCVSWSDTVCVTQFPKFVVPNTFTPNGDGRNDFFIPVKAFVRASDFLMLIYTRWGQQIFETTDVNEGWDGLIKGFPAQADAYVYYVTFVIKGGIPVTRAGTVLLLK